jgi:hypothetical protein
MEEHLVRQRNDQLSRIIIRTLKNAADSRHYETMQ